MENGLWKPVYGYEGYYEINEKGIIKGVERVIHFKNLCRKINAKILSSRINNCGYLEVRLSKDGRTKTRPVHVLLAEVFIPNPDNKPEVNHINGNKIDNRIENLEWVTHSENMLHAYALGLCPTIDKEKPVVDVCEGRVFPSVRKAAEYYTIPYSTVKGYLNGNRNNPTCLRYLVQNAAWPI